VPIVNMIRDRGYESLVVLTSEGDRYRNSRAPF
jgi:hypothetical protein